MDIKPSLAVIVPIGLLLLSGCGNADEYASFQSADSGALPDCIAEQFPFEPDFLAARTRDGRTGIFLQTSPDVKSRSDAVYFELYDTASVETDSAIDLVEASEPPPGSRSKMVFFSSCFNDRESLELRGSITFDSFGTDRHDVISGELVDGRALDARTGETVVDDLSGSWRFVVRRGPPHEDFFALPERP